MKSAKLVLIICLVNTTFLIAQEKNKFRFDLNLGYASSVNSERGGLLYLEPKWTLTASSTIGLRLGVALYARDFDTNDQRIVANSEERLGASATVLGTYDWYFHKDGSLFAPFIGIGVGYFELANVEDNNTLSRDQEIETNAKLGGMVRAGFDLGKLRLSLDYNLVGKSDLRNQDNEVIGESDNGYLGIALGFYFGGGKWNR